MIGENPFLALKKLAWRNFESKCHFWNPSTPLYVFIPPDMKSNFNRRRRSRLWQGGGGMKRAPSWMGLTMMKSEFSAICFCLWVLGKLLNKTERKASLLSGWQRFAIAQGERIRKMTFKFNFFIGHCTRQCCGFVSGLNQLQVRPKESASLCFKAMWVKNLSLTSAQACQ